MFHYTPGLNWTDGVFLRPHHFQQVQEERAAARASDRALCLPYAYGLYQLEIDETALEHYQLHINKLQAILPGGAELDLPGNSTTDMLDLTKELSDARELTIYIALPPLRSGEPNTQEGSASDTPTRYEPAPADFYDLNAGGNEQSIMLRRQRILLATSADKLPGYEKMPILRLECHRNRDGQPSLAISHGYSAPALCLAGAPELLQRADALCRHLDKIATNMTTTLRRRDMQSAEKATARLEKMTKGAAISSACSVIRQLAAVRTTSPVALYTELCRLMMQLAAYRPLEDIAAPPLYVHDDCLPQFDAVLAEIYRLTATEATEWCVRVELSYREEQQAWFGKLEDEWLPAIRTAYVSVQSPNPPRRVADLVEEGDAFKLTAASQACKRVRGVRLAEDRLPSPLLPVDGSCLWFQAGQLDRDNSWLDITEERECALTWSPQMLPDTKAALYLILSAPDHN